MLMRFTVIVENNGYVVLDTTNNRRFFKKRSFSPCKTFGSAMRRARELEDRFRIQVDVTAQSYKKPEVKYLPDELFEII